MRLRPTGSKTGSAGSKQYRKSYRCRIAEATNKADGSAIYLNLTTTNASADTRRKARKLLELKPW